MLKRDFKKVYSSIFPLLTNMLSSNHTKNQNSYTRCYSKFAYKQKSKTCIICNANDASNKSQKNSTKKHWIYVQSKNLDPVSNWLEKQSKQLKCQIGNFHVSNIKQHFTHSLTRKHFTHLTVYHAL